MNFSNSTSRNICALHVFYTTANIHNSHKQSSDDFCSFNKWFLRIKLMMHIIYKMYKWPTNCEKRKHWPNNFTNAVYNMAIKFQELVCQNYLLINYFPEYLSISPTSNYFLRKLSQNVTYSLSPGFQNDALVNCNH